MSCHYPRRFRSNARSGLPLRAGPKGSAAILARIPSGETVSATGPARRGWIPVRYDSPDGPKAGYCCFRYLTDLSDPYLYPEEAVRAEE